MKWENFSLSIGVVIGIIVVLLIIGVAFIYFTSVKASGECRKEAVGVAVDQPYLVPQYTDQSDIADEWYKTCMRAKGLEPYR